MLVDLLPEQHYKRSLSQLTMEWKWLILVYESRLWRRNPFFELGMGISFAEEYETILRAVRLRGEENILDLACGTGIYTRHIARTFPRGTAVGLDLSMPMLKYACWRSDREGIANQFFVHANVLDIPFPAASFDAVICCGALHLFPKPRRVLIEVGRVLKPGGRFAMAAFRHGYGRISAYMRRLINLSGGVRAFSPNQLEEYFYEAGLNHIQCHHAQRLWLIMSGIKP
ncbi:MAG: class I SAM-dependent methyltransferase [Syntrophales bacterium]|jgi:ubiquinone/menaquinone biosynthesis C-methylase UbiE